MKRLCIICARAGSKGVKNKNFRPFLGKPLFLHTIDQARESKQFDDIAVSSDSKELLELARTAGIKWLVERPLPLASDESDKAPAVLHCARDAERQSGTSYETFVDLDVTAPLRTADHIREAITFLESTDAPNIFSVSPSRRSPYYNVVEVGADGEIQVCKILNPVPVRRQDVPRTYDVNASIYAWRRAAFFESGAGVLLRGTKLFVMPEYTAFDIDGEFDFQLTELLYANVRMQNGN